MEPKSPAEARPSSLFNHPDNKSNFELFYKYLSQPSRGIFVCQGSEGERLKIFRFFDADPLREHIHIIDMIQPLINPMELQESIIHTHEKYAPKKNIFFIYNLKKCIYLSGISTIDFFQKLNLIRDFFMRYDILFVFFMEENTLKQMIQHAVDFYDWIMNIFIFVQETGLQLEPFLEIEDNREIKYSKPYKRISYLKKVIETGVNEKEKSKNLNELAHLYKQIGDIDKARELLLEGLKTIEKSTDLPVVAGFYKDIGDIYAEKGDYDPALKFYLDALKLFKQLKDRRNQAYAYFQVGYLAWAKQDYPDAKSNYHEALNIYSELKDIYEQARTHHRLGMVAEGAQYFLEAAHHFQEASKLKEEIEEQRSHVISRRREKIGSDFFITYHHHDEMAARWIAAELKQAHFTTLSDSWDFIQGQTPLEKIEYMSGVSRNVMVLISRQFLQSRSDIESWQAVIRTPPVPSVSSVAKSISMHIVRIKPCEIEKVLGAVEYLDLAGIKEAEAVKRLLDAVGAAGAEKKETEPLSVSAGTPAEILAKRKQELDQLLYSTIKGNYHMKLDLEQETEKEVEIKNGKTGEMEKRKQWVWEPVPLDTVLKDSKNYILVNPSGMGKTTFLTYAACALLDRDANYPFLPLFFTCIALNNRAGAIEDFILHQVESIYTPSQGTLVSGEWENLCVLIDALDQARDVDDIVSSLQLHEKPFHYKKAKIILSSRQSTADMIKEGFNKIRLKLPVDDEVQYYLGEESYILLESLIHSSGELVAVPVLLEMLKAITEKGHVVSTLTNRAGLYTEFTKVLLDQERSKPRFWQDRLSIRHFIDFELEQVLEKIAFFSLADNEIMEIPMEKLTQYCESPEKKEALLNIGIILELFEDREQKIVFRHQSFQAYFAARYIYYQMPDLFKEITKDIRFFYNDAWYEVMRFFVGLEKDPQKAEAIIDAVYQTKNKKVDLNHDKDKYVRSDAAEAIEQIYKRSTPKLRIDKVVPKTKKKKVLSIKTFSAQTLHILHISDIHYALEKDPTITCIFHEFLQDIEKWRGQQNNTNIQAICLTGDIAQAGQEIQYLSINEIITAILNTTGCAKENLFIVPGNHDVRDYDQISPQGKTLLEQVRENKINIDAGVLSSVENYRQFHDKFANYYKFIEKSGYLNSLPENHNDIPRPWYNRELTDFPVRIIGLNSALFCIKGFSQYGNIRMGTSQFHEAYFQGKVGDRPDHELVILLTHHPLNWLAENEYDDYSTLMERYSVIHFHGHIHKTKIEKKQKLFSSAGGYVSIGTGSLYGEKGKEDIDTYHILTFDFENQELHVWARRWNPDTGKWTVYDDDGNNRFPLPVKR